MRAGSEKTMDDAALVEIVPLFPRTPITPGRRSDEAWKAAPEPAPSHPSWKTLRVSHSLAGHDDGLSIHN